jgi:hypothetical protein
VRGEDGLWSAAVWLMTGGSYAVRVGVSGRAGSGALFVPVAAVATRTLEMSRAFGGMLLVLGALLFAGAVSLVGAAAREAVLPVGEAVDGRRLWRGRAAMTIALVLLAIATWKGRRWWDLEDAAYRGALYRAPSLGARVAADGTLHLRVADEPDGRPRPWRLAPDHGKLMHVFLVREPRLDVLAHLHPVVGPWPTAFEAPLPALPAGRYRLYADVTHDSGFAETLTGVVSLPSALGAGARALAADPDDSWHVGAPADGAPVADLGDGYALTQETDAGASIVSGRELMLRFRVRDGAGRDVVPEPYMGMSAHAAVTREDGTVFVHLHPSGTASMAAQLVFAAREGTPAADVHAAHRAADAGGALTFPYAFPKPGRYRIWVQVKVEGAVRTGAFDLTVD